MPHHTNAAVPCHTAKRKPATNNDDPAFVAGGGWQRETIDRRILHPHADAWRRAMYAFCCLTALGLAAASAEYIEHQGTSHHVSFLLGVLIIATAGCLTATLFCWRRSVSWRQRETPIVVEVTRDTQIGEDPHNFY